MILYRPVGLFEMEKILDNDGKEYPPRFPEQPIFYPVLNENYANQIAEKWNKDDSNSGFVGFVTEFEIDDHYVKKYEIHCVGSNIHQELWIPAEKLTEFNENILGRIQIKQVYYGNEYSGICPTGKTGFKENIIDKQINILKSILDYNYMDFSGTVFVEWKIINLNFLFWYDKAYLYNKTLESIYNCLIKNKKLYISKTLKF